MRFQTPTVLIVLLSVLTLTSAADTPPTSVEIKVTNPVECTRKTKKGDKLDMHYRGTIWGTGAEFDASYNRGQPFHFELGAGRVIKGWDEGLLDMCIGEKRTLTIPPEFGYGQRAMGSIPAGSTLVFETELMGIKVGVLGS